VTRHSLPHHALQDAKETLTNLHALRILALGEG